MSIETTDKKINNKRLATQQSVNGAIKSICNSMRRSNCAGALQYVPKLTWILFLRILDERETRQRGRCNLFTLLNFRVSWGGRVEDRLNVPLGQPLAVSAVSSFMPV